MTRAGIERLVKEWQPRLGLSHWDIEVLWDDDAKEYLPDDNKKFHAGTWRSKDYDRAKIYVNPDEYTDWSDFTAAVNIVHELLHLVMRDVEFIVEHFDGLFHRDVDRVVTDTFEHHVEGAIDRLAHRFVELKGV